MAVKMRLRREGKKKQPFYRVVVADVRSPRDGRFIEDIGYYHPLKDPSDISIDRDRALHWLRNGCQPTDAVVNLLRIEGIWQEFRPEDAERQAQRAEARKAKRDAKATKKASAQPQAQADTAPAADAAPAAAGDVEGEPAAEPAEEASAE
jgi:small subunit ribosomal protein S16